MNYNVEFGYGAAKDAKTFSSIEELKVFLLSEMERSEIPSEN